MRAVLPESRYRVPSRCREESGRVASRIRPICDIVEDFRMGILKRSQSGAVLEGREQHVPLTRIGLTNPTVVFPAAILSSLTSVSREAHIGAAKDVPPIVYQELLNRTR